MDEDTIPDELTPEQRYEDAIRPWLMADIPAPIPAIMALRDMLASRDAELDRLTDDNRRLEQRIERLERAR